jgi:hypothetical protein
MSPELDDDHAEAICRVLIDHGVEFVVIGGMAARLHRTGHATIDIDICPARSDGNLERLAAALRALGARLRVENEPDGVPFDLHPDTLRSLSMLTLVTDSGPLDICFAPAGFPTGYEQLSRHAVTIIIGSTDVAVASLGDVIHSKRAAGRPKDIVALPDLEAHARARGNKPGGNED